jgi:hypothetical protein
MKQLIVVFMVAVLLSAFSTANAGVTVFNFFSEPGNSLFLNSGGYHTWELTYNLAPGEYITGATITYVGVLATNYTPADRLFTDLLDVPGPDSEYVGVHDPDGQYYGYFDNCFRWHEGWTTQPATYTYDLNAPDINLLNELGGFLQNPTFAVGTEPLGNFSINNIIFELTTQNVIPAPGALLLGSIGVACLGYLRLRKQRIL